MRSAEDFRRTVRGARAGRPTLVVHVAAVPRTGVRVGFVVSKAVGGAVRRNLVKRRLRHLAAAQLAVTPDGTDVVVRALPAAGRQPDAVRDDLPAAWSAALRRRDRR